MKKRLLMTGSAVALGVWGFSRRVRDRSRIAPGLGGPITWFKPSPPTRVNRFFTRLIGAVQTPAGNDVSVEERVIRGADGTPLTIYIYRPKTITKSQAGLLYIHGGGMVVGSARMYNILVSAYARELGVVTVSPEYRLAPEHRYPAPLDDVETTYKWMLANAEELGVDPEALVVAGESAGGGLAASLCQRLLDDGAQLPRLQALIYPMLDDRTCLREQPPHIGQILWTPAANEIGWRSYLGREPGTGTPPTAAVPARRERLEGLPPAWIGVGTLDLFHDEDLEYADRLKQAGVPCEFVEVEGAYHGFDVAHRTHPEVTRFRNSLLSAIERAFTTPETAH